MAGDFGFGLGDLVVQPHEAKDLREFSPTSEADLSAAMDFACRLHTETGLDAPSPR
jgi:hypothetical protein